REQLARQLSFPVAVTDGDTVSQESSPIRSFPPEHIGRKSLFVWLGTHENVRIHPLQFVDLRKGGGMAEGVRVITDARHASKQSPEEHLAVKTLARQRFARRGVHIGLHPPAAGNRPPSFLDPLAYFLEHLRISLCHPLVELGRAGSKGDVGILLHAIQGRAKGAEHNRLTFGPLP